MGTFSPAEWAKEGSPGPKLMAGMPASDSLDTSVQPYLGAGLSPVRATNSRAMSDSSPGLAPGALSMTSSSQPSKSDTITATASSTLRSGAKR
jgi:hypothetical protein